MRSEIKTWILGISILVLTGCTKYWDEHYDIYPETVNESVWDAIQSDPEISDFVQLLKEHQGDTLFGSNIPYTIFAPTNTAISAFLAEQGEVTDNLIGYHICSHFIQSGNIQGKRQVQTITEKFALFEKYGSKVSLDGIPVEKESPLYANGKYFILTKVAEPRPNLYEYFKLTNPVLSDYIDSQDSIILDKERSKPLGFDENGNTVYDTVSIIYNKFEGEYFPVKHEFRNLTGTIVFPQQDDYRNALTEMALALGSGYNNYSDIPLEWQNRVLIPHLLEQGVFLNMLEPEEFVWESPKDTLKLLNVLGDSIVIYYEPTEKAVCSNGYAYNYKDFTIPDSLYTSGTRVEGEWLLDETGVDKFSWNERAVVKSDSPYKPYQELISTASNDSILRVLFDKGYTGKYSVEFETPSLFPRRYVMVVSTHMDIGGIYDIYVNDELVKTFDYYDFIKYRGIMPSVISGKRYVPVGRFNKFDMWVENIYEYGRAKIRFEYKAPGSVLSNGFVMDCLEFVPAAN